MISRSSRAQAIVNAALAKKKNNKKKKSSVTLYVEENRPPWQAAKHLRSFRALDRFRKPRK